MREGETEEREDAGAVRQAMSKYIIEGEREEN